MTKPAEMKLFKCRHCNKDKPADEMRKDRRTKHGVDTECKACRNERESSNGTYIRNRVRMYQNRKDGDRVYLTIEEIEALLKQRECVYCDDVLSAKTVEIDHVYPLTWDYGGESVAMNLVASCVSCNRSKKNKHVYEFYQSSEKFTPKLWDEFCRMFARRIFGDGITDAHVHSIKQGFKEEAEELRRNAAKDEERAI